MRPSHNSACTVELSTVLAIPVYRIFQSSWYPCIYWYLYIQKMTDESDTTPFYKKKNRERPYIFTGYFMDGGATECKLLITCISQVTLRNLISALTRNRKFILCGRTSNIICKFPHKYHQAQNVTKFNKSSFSNRYLTHIRLQMVNYKRYR